MDTFHGSVCPGGIVLTTHTSQFDSLAGLYEDFSALPFRQHLEFPSVLALIEHTENTRILDLGCGSGVYSRRLAAHGAGQVLGLDESPGMIDYARRREHARPLGIDYVIGPLPTALAGSFDLVVAVYVLPYATNYDDLVGLCRTAADALRPGGRLITLPIHPEFHPDPDYYAPYGFRLIEQEPRADASPVGLDLRFGHHDAHVTARYWTAETLEVALSAVGFAAPAWHPHRVSAEAEGDPFFRAYLESPHAAILTAVKKHHVV